jgi:hypothetical protein
MRGSCLCGAVRFEVAEPFVTASHCHCQHCKRISGGVGTTSGRVPTSAIRILEGRGQLRSYTPPGGTAKTFCSVCGSNLFGGGWPRSEMTPVRVSAIDSDFDAKPERHLFVRSVAPWEMLPEDGLPRYDTRPA